MYEYIAHGPWVFMKPVGKVYCRRCGFVRLHNMLSDFVFEKGCESDEHPQYKSMIMRSSNESKRTS